MSRHGESLHLIRPDRIVRTGVVQSIVGYQPQADVMAVTSEFVNGPASGMQLAGFGAPKLDLFGGLRRGWYKLKAAVASAGAKRMMLTNATPAIQAAMQQTAPIVAAGPFIPSFMGGRAMAPQFYAMQEMAHFLSMRGVAPARGELFPQRRWNTYYYAG